MKQNTLTPLWKSPVKPARLVFMVTLFFLALSGFGQMPIFKRYYIADIPGLAWLADFYITRNLHYLFAVLFLGLIFYFAVDFLLRPNKSNALSFTGYLRVAILSGVTLSGALIVLKNFPVYLFSPGTVIAINLFHLIFVMLFLAISLFCLMFKKKWTTRVQNRM